MRVKKSDFLLSQRLFTLMSDFLITWENFQSCESPFTHVSDCGSDENEIMRIKWRNRNDENEMMTLKYIQTKIWWSWSDENKIMRLDDTKKNRVGKREIPLKERIALIFTCEWLQFCWEWERNDENYNIRIKWWEWCWKQTYDNEKESFFTNVRDYIHLSECILTESRDSLITYVSDCIYGENEMIRTHIQEFSISWVTYHLLWRLKFCW